MPRYGIKRTSVYNRTRYAGAAKRTATQKVARAAYVRKARAKPTKKAVRANAGGVASNARAITRLKREAYGPIQKQISRWDGNATSSNLNPFFFQVNNFGTGHNGPRLFNYNVHASTTEHLQKLNKQWFVGNNFGKDQDALDLIPNGPVLFAKYVKLDFRFSGFLHNCRIRIDVFRQKSMARSDAWNPHTASSGIFPLNAKEFQRLAGWTMNSIDRKQFQVMQTKHVYFNSAGTAASIPDDMTGQHTVRDPTTNAVKLCSVYIPLNREFRQLGSSLGEDTRVDHHDEDVHQDAHNISGAGSWQYDNQHPLKNVWIMISTDDSSDITDTLTGDALKIECMRTCVWRDKRGDADH